MYRSVGVFVNDLDGAIADFNAEPPFLEIHVVVYDGAAGGSAPELIHLRQVFGDY